MARYDVLKNLSHGKKLYQAGSTVDLDPEEAEKLPEGVVKPSEKPAEGAKDSPAAGKTDPAAARAVQGGDESKPAKGPGGRD